MTHRLTALLQGSFLLSDFFPSLHVAMGGLMRLILIKMYLYWEKKGDTESMNFNTENPHLICLLQPHSTAGCKLIAAGGAGL